jgi:hypothetical protein
MNHKKLVGKKIQLYRFNDLDQQFDKLNVLIQALKEENQDLRNRY